MQLFLSRLYKPNSMQYVCFWTGNEPKNIQEFQAYKIKALHAEKNKLFKTDPDYFDKEQCIEKEFTTVKNWKVNQ